MLLGELSSNRIASQRLIGWCTRFEPNKLRIFRALAVQSFTPFNLLTFNLNLLPLTYCLPQHTTKRVKSK